MFGNLFGGFFNGIINSLPSGSNFDDFMVSF